jgi:hypothetical protein
MTTDFGYRAWMVLQYIFNAPIFACLILPSVVFAADPVSTSGPEVEKLGYFSAPNYRGTLDILWSCLFTIFLCCWTAIHVDIPPPGSPWQQQYLDRTICLLIGTIAPEIFIYIAFFERMGVRNYHKNSPPGIEADKWTLAHIYFAEMGGFCVRFPDPNSDGPETVGNLSRRALYDLLREGHIQQSELPTEGSIKDKGKADGIIKVFTLVQILWLLIQSIARGIQHLPLTTLEISTLAYIPCAILVYYLWWDKPYDVNVPIELHISPPIASHPQSEPGGFERKWGDDDQIDVRRGANVLEMEERHEWWKRDVQVYKNYGMTRQCLVAIASTLTPINRWGFLSASVLIVVGGVHLSAWSFSFPSTTEKWLWRASSLIITTSIPLSWTLTHIISRLVESVTARQDVRRTVKIARWIQGFGVGLYALARFYLLVEVFASLRRVESGVFKTPDWTMFIPHID